MIHTITEGMRDYNSITKSFVHYNVIKQKLHSRVSYQRGTHQELHVILTSYQDWIFFQLDLADPHIVQLRNHQSTNQPTTSKRLID